MGRKCNIIYLGTWCGDTTPYHVPYKCSLRLATAVTKFRAEYNPSYQDDIEPGVGNCDTVDLRDARGYRHQVDLVST